MRLTYFPDAKELTRHGFVSHMEDFIGKLIGDDPLRADVDDYLKGFDIDAPKAIEMLTKREIEDVPESAVIIRTERIKNGGTDEFGKPMKDQFQVSYKVPKRDAEKGIKGVDEKLRNMYIKLFENHIVEGTILNEEDGGCGMCCGEGEGGPGAENSGQYTTPLFRIVRKKVYSPKTKKNESTIRRTMYITEDQLKQLRQLMMEDDCGGCDGDGGFGGGALTDSNIGAYGSYPWYDTPMSTKKKKDPSLDHSDLFSMENKDNEPTGHDGRSFKNESKSGIHIKEKNKGKFTATKKRTGKSTEELTHSKNPLTRKRANFARMVKRGWKPLKKDD